jgi:hypothetical protein
MRASRRAKSNHLISSCVILIAIAVGGALVCVVALPLAQSNPFPVSKHAEWILQAPLQAHLQSHLQTPETSEAPEADAPATYTLASAPASAPAATYTLASVPPATVDPAPSLPAPSSVAIVVEDDAAVVTSSIVEKRPAPQSSDRMDFMARWDLTRPAPIGASTVVVTNEATRLTPAARTAEAAPRRHREVASLEVGAQDINARDVDTKDAGARKLGLMDPVDEYLWEVYQRQPVKKDSSGDFSWKDPAAAKHVGMTMEQYVIGGMDPDFREQLYHAGRAMDASGIHWSMLSAFRDDYRQNLASGFKAHGGNSLHGGSRATGGYGHGRAIDITTADGEASAVWHWIDVHGGGYGLRRPMPGADPAHIQPKSMAYHDLAHQLREARTRLANDMSGAVPEASVVKMKVADLGESHYEGHRHRRW